MLYLWKLFRVGKFEISDHCDMYPAKLSNPLFAILENKFLSNISSVISKGCMACSRKVFRLLNFNKKF